MRHRLLLCLLLCLPAAAQDTATDAPPPVLGTWHIRVADDRPVPDGATMTLTFHDDGTLAFTGLPGPTTGTWSIDDEGLLQMTVTNAGSSMDSTMRLTHAGETLHMTKLPRETVSVLTRDPDTIVPRLAFDSLRAIEPAGTALHSQEQLYGYWDLYSLNGAAPTDRTLGRLVLSRQGAYWEPSDFDLLRTPAQWRWDAAAGLTLEWHKPRPADAPLPFDSARPWSAQVDADGVLYLQSTGEQPGPIAVLHAGIAPDWLHRLATGDDTPRRHRRRMSEVRQLLMGMYAYTIDHDQPPASLDDLFTRDYLGSRFTGRDGWEAVGLVDWDWEGDDSRRVLLIESAGHRRGDGRVVAGFADGHAEVLTEDELDALLNPTP